MGFVSKAASKVAAKFCCGGKDARLRSRSGSGSPRKRLAALAASPRPPRLLTSRSGTPAAPAAVQWKALAEEGHMHHSEEPTAAWRSGAETPGGDHKRRTGAVDVVSAGCLARGRTHVEVQFDEGVAQMLAMLEPGGRLGDLRSVARGFGTSSLARRLLKKSDGNVKKASDLFEQALRWCESHEELLKTRRHRLGSDERVMGVNANGRPVIYLCMKNQMLSSMQCVDQKVCTMLQAIDCMPEGVENVVQIWDMHGLGFRASDLNLGPLIKELQTQEAFFAERLREIVIVGMPRFATVLKDLAWPFVPDKTKKKIRFLADDSAARNYLESTCDEKLAGRLSHAMRENRDSSITLERRKSGWQRMNEFGQLVSLSAGTLP